MDGCTSSGLTTTDGVSVHVVWTMLCKASYSSENAELAIAVMRSGAN
jgi:hypothetical protein